MTPRGVQHRGGQPGPDRRLGQHRVQRVPEPHAVQGVAGRAGTQPPGHPLGGRDHAVQTLGLLEPGEPEDLGELGDVTHEGGCFP